LDLVSDLDWGWGMDSASVHRRLVDEVPVFPYNPPLLSQSAAKNIRVLRLPPA